jgi:hypothetical protein
VGAPAAGGLSRCDLRRAAIFAALRSSPRDRPQPDDPKEAKKLQAFIASLTNWDNYNGYTKSDMVNGG